MRQFGEDYISIYRPPMQHIKLIRAMRLCRTPGLGGKKYICKKCQHEHTVYFSCGKSHCSICQAVKREQWVDKLTASLYDVPYVHLVTTMPHQLNMLARKYPKKLYNILFQATNNTVQKIFVDANYVGATPGMISVLHT